MSLCGLIHCQDCGKIEKCELLGTADDGQPDCSYCKDTNKVHIDKEDIRDYIGMMTDWTASFHKEAKQKRNKAARCLKEWRKNYNKAIRSSWITCHHC